MQFVNWAKSSSYLIKSQIVARVKSADVLRERQGGDVGLGIAGPASSPLPSGPWDHRAASHLRERHKFVARPRLVSPEREQFSLG